MVAHNMTLIYHSCYQFRLTFEVIESTEKGCRNFFTFKHIKDFSCKIIVLITTVKGQICSLGIRTNEVGIILGVFFLL